MTHPSCHIQASESRSRIHRYPLWSVERIGVLLATLQTVGARTLSSLQSLFSNIGTNLMALL